MALQELQLGGAPHFASIEASQTNLLVKRQARAVKMGQMIFLREGLKQEIESAGHDEDPIALLLPFCQLREGLSSQLRFDLKAVESLAERRHLALRPRTQPAERQVFHPPAGNKPESAQHQGHEEPGAVKVALSQNPFQIDMVGVNPG